MIDDPEHPTDVQHADRRIDSDDLARRREQLDRQLSARRNAEVRETAPSRGNMQGMAQGMKIASEFVAGVAVGALLGYGIDAVFGTRPFGLIVFLLLGFVAGVLNVIRGANAASKTAAAPATEDTSPPRGE